MASHILPRAPKKALLLATAVALLALGFAAPAWSADTMDPQAAGASGACPALTAAKYPWLTCEANEYGGVTLSLPGQPAPLECRMRLPDGECAASAREWGLVPAIPNSAD